MREITLGQYYPVDSPVHRMDARIKLLVSILYIVMLFFVRHFIVFAVIAAILLAVIFVSRVPLIKILKSLKIIIFLMIFTLVMTILFYSGGGTLWLSFWIINNLHKFRRDTRTRTFRHKVFFLDDLSGFHVSG